MENAIKKERFTIDNFLNKGGRGKGIEETMCEKKRKRKRR